MSWIPPALKLKPQSEIKATSALRAILDAEHYWPSEILEQPFVLLETTTAPLLFLTDPQLVKEVLNRNDGTLPRSRLQQRFAGHGTGHENVIVDSGSRSQVHRRSLAPLFKPQSITEYYPFIQKTIDKVLQPLADNSVYGQPYDLGRLSVHATFGVIWQIMFGHASLETPSEIVEVLADKLYEAGLSGNLITTAKTVQYAREISMKLRPTEPLAPLSPFALNTPAGIALTTQEISDNAQFLITAGHESTALTISWAFYILANAPSEQDLIAEEIAKVLHNGEITMESLNKMTRLDQLLHEAMRLYPAGIVINREAVEDTKIDYLNVAAGTQIAISFYGMHRHRAHWDKPDEFIPERFNTKAVSSKNSAFMPFSGGRHSCLGARLAWVEAMYTLASVLKDYKISPASTVMPLARYTLRPNDRLMITVSSR
jgi:cytochrome P450